MMKIITTANQNQEENSENSRRKFIKNTAILTALTGIGLITHACKENPGEEEVTPAEDLMREHGLLTRILLIYDACKLHLKNNEQFDMAAIVNSAQIIRTFVEDYHEKLEENFLFPRFEKANQLTDLVQTLRAQHTAGRRLTDQMLQLAKASDASTNQNLVKLIDDFNRMYRPHKAREDTVLFPAIKKVVSEDEYFDLGESFEDKEHELFGENGFESMVDKVAAIEKSMNIYELSSFTPV